VQDILRGCEAREDCYLWQNNSGAAKIGGRYVRFGLKGSSDIIGLTSDGKFLAIECKIGKDRQSEDQIAFENAIKGMGGRYLAVKQASEAFAYLDSVLGRLVS
jgi:hypothetical protein